MRSILICWLLATPGAWAGPQMRVAICNMGHLSAKVVTHAQDDLEHIFRAAGIQIIWQACGEPSPDPVFALRLRTGGKMKGSLPASLQTMGAAFVTPGHTGYLADAYYGAIQEVARANGACDATQLLGHVLAHEIGHLLLGAPHAGGGIMSAAWSRPHLVAAGQRALRFTSAQRAALQHELLARTALPIATVTGKYSDPANSPPTDIPAKSSPYR
jgi:hypothetical protein